MILLSYPNFVFKEACSNNQKNDKTKRRLCGFVSNFDKKCINFNDPLWGKISYYEVEIQLHRYIQRCIGQIQE